MIHYAASIEDYHRVILHYIQQQEWTKAVDALCKQVSSRV